MSEQDTMLFERAFRQVLRKLIAEWNRQLGPGMTVTQVFILEKLEAEGQQKPSALAEMLSITCGAVTGLVDKLIAAGYVERHRTDDDRRVIYLSITEQGKAALAEKREIRKQVIGRFFQGISQEDVKHLSRIFQQISSNLDWRP